MGGTSHKVLAAILFLLTSPLCRAPNPGFASRAAHAATQKGFDVRVSKGLFSRDYDVVRMSVITDEGQASPISPDVDWDYEASFSHRWTSKSIHTKVLHVGDHGKTVHLGRQELHLKLPAPGQPVAGLLVADPCFSSSREIACTNGRRFGVLERLTSLINQLAGSGELDFWGIVGNNFYDEHGAFARDFFSRLSTVAKSKPFITVPGSHDFWTLGSPPGKATDQLGYGFAQFYGQDTIASAGGDAPYTFSNEGRRLGYPAGELYHSGASSSPLPPAENFIFGTHLGDLAFFGYSGAHEWSVTRPHAVDFCNYVQRTPTVNTIILLGNWNKEYLGCRPGMDVPSVYRKLQALPGCDQKRMLYFMGGHCNKVTLYGEHQDNQGPLEAAGFMIGGAGTSGNGCSQFGVTLIKSVHGSNSASNVRVDHFPIAADKPDGKTVDSFEQLSACFNRSGYAGCRDKFGLSFRATSADSIVTPAVTAEPVRVLAPYLRKEATTQNVSSASPNEVAATQGSAAPNGISTWNRKISSAFGDGHGVTKIVVAIAGGILCGGVSIMALLWLQAYGDRISNRNMELVPTSAEAASRKSRLIAL